MFTVFPTLQINLKKTSYNDTLVKWPREKQGEEVIRTRERERPPSGMCNIRLAKHYRRKHTLLRECELVGPTPTVSVMDSPKRHVANGEWHLVPNNMKLIVMREGVQVTLLWILHLGKHKEILVVGVQANNFSTETILLVLSSWFRKVLKKSPSCGWSIIFVELLPGT